MSHGLGNPAPPWARAAVAWTVRHGRMLWVIALLLAVPAVWRTANMYMHLRSELEELLPRNAQSVVAIDELRKRMPGLQYLGVIVDSGSPENLPAGEKLLDDLAARVRAYPPELVREVRLGQAEEKAFLEKNAALYTDLEDLKTIRARIEARRDYEVNKQTGASLDDDEAPPPLDFTDLEAKYKERLGGSSDAKDRFPNGRWSNAQQHVSLMLIEVAEFSSGRGRGTELLDRVKADIVSMGGTDHYAPNMKVGYTGDVAISVEETSALLTDLSFSSIIVLVLVVAVLVVYYRWSRSVLVLLPPLLLATVYSFAIASFPPFNVRELNSNTAFLGSIIVGNGINFAIILLARYIEERRAGVNVDEALVVGVWGSRVGTLSAALAAGVSYASLALTDFRGFAQFGYIGGIGMVMSWLTAYLLMPSLTKALDKDPKAHRRVTHGGFMAPFAKLVTRHSGIVIAATAVLLVLSVHQLSRFGANELEYDFSKLRRADTWVSGEGYWGRKMDALLGTYLTPTVILTDSPEQAHAVEEAVRRAWMAKDSPLHDMISNIRTIDDVLPKDQAAKFVEADAIREDMTPKMRSLVPEDKKEQIDRLLANEENKPITFADLPHTFTTGLRERDGSYGRAVLVFPRPSRALWEGPPLAQFVESLRTIARDAVGPEAKPARVAGSLPLSADILESIRRDGIKASAAALAGVILVVLLLFRTNLISVYIIGGLLLGVVWLAGGMMAFGVRINFANFIAFPITFGIGVDYAVNVMARYAQDGRRDVGLAVRATGGAVALCSLTTTIGYSSLLMAQNRALFLFGLVAVLGELACVSAAILALPALVSWLDKRRGGRRSTAPESSPGSEHGRPATH
ncbi:MMPL family transporter [Pendulispora brunnea]|uniref:MMPL family transporter n=1 Tax=Pendulispora brunnea TaxID=2905690 RepID=A0ABZ2KIJ0_9BACT